MHAICICSRMFCMGYETKENRSEKWIFLPILYFVFETIEPSATERSASENNKHYLTQGWCSTYAHSGNVVFYSHCAHNRCSIAGGRIVVVNQPIKIKESLVFISFVQLLRVYGFTGRYRLHGRTAHMCRVDCATSYANE